MNLAADFYDDQYYRDHYGKIYDSRYYEKVSRFWKYNIFDKNAIHLEKDTRLLDFGAGLGQITAATGGDCFDPSPVAVQFLKSKGRKVYQNIEEVPEGVYDYLVSSHSLEHSLEPAKEIQRFKQLLKRQGVVILILPCEPTPGTPISQQDDNKHFYCWNFQTIGNLLIESDFEILKQRLINGPTGLSKINNMSIITFLGKIVNNYPSILTIARLKI